MILAELPVNEWLPSSLDGWAKVVVLIISACALYFGLQRKIGDQGGELGKEIALQGQGLHGKIDAKARELDLKVGFLEQTVKHETAEQNRKIDGQSEEIKLLTKSLQFIQLHEQRMNNMESLNNERFSNLIRTVNDLRHGRGRITEEEDNSGHGLAKRS